AGIAHYQFEAIHPFEDGNGRLGRLLIPIQLISRGLIDAPLVNLSPYLERRRDTYLELLKRVSTRGDWQQWLMFFLRAVHAQADDARSRTRALIALHEKYRNLVRSGSRSQAPLVAVDLLMEQVFVSARDVAAYASCEYNTARAALTTMTGMGIVAPLEGTYPQLWYAREVLEEVYQDGAARAGVS
ncbi:MAG: Fic family protein, partial [Gemmataceae bacterium]|nr:Fic family protein [Gemmataceae bacterium]